MSKNLLDLLKITDDEFIDFLKLGKDILTMQLSDPGAIKEPVHFQADKRYAMHFDDLHVTSRIDASNMIQLFNNGQDDMDADQLLAIDPSDPHGIIPFSQDHPVIKYTFQLHASGSLGASTGNLDFGLEKNATIRSISYFKHDGNERVSRAILDDIKRFKFIFLKDHIQNLRVGEGVHFSAMGSLGLAFDIHLADMFSAGLSHLSDLVSSAGVVSVDVQAGPAASVYARIQDAFALTISKTATQTYALAVRKSVQKTSGAGLSAGITVQFADPGQIEKLVGAKTHQIIRSLTDQIIEDEARLEELLSHAEAFSSGSHDLADFLDAHPQWEKAVRILIKKFGLEVVEDQLRTLINRLKSLKTDIFSAITKGIQQKVEASIAFEYQRVSSHEELIRAVITEEALRKYHGDLIRFRTIDFLTEAGKPGNDVVLQQFFREKEVIKKMAWGVNIGIGNFRVRGKDTRELAYKETLSLRADDRVHRKVSLDGLRGYSGRLGGEEVNWWANFQAEMGSYSIRPVPTVSEFDFGFQLIYEHREHWFRKREADQCMQLIDRAACWNVIPHDRVRATFDDLWPRLAGKTKHGRKDRDIRFQLALNVTPDAFAQLRQKMDILSHARPGQHLKYIAYAMGRIIPYHPDFLLRQDIARRTRVYGELWEYYLKASGFEMGEPGQDRSVDLNAFLQVVKARLDEEDSSGKLGKYELRFAERNAPSGGRMGQIIRLNPAMTRRWEAFARGIARLTEAITSNTNHNYEKVLRTAYREIESAWAQSDTFLATGVYFLLMAGEDPTILKNIERTLEIRFLDDNRAEQVILLRGI